MGIFEQLQHSIQLNQEKEQLLEKAIDDGYRFFKEFNDNRMELAFSLFSEDMKKALFEIIYFLHVNDSKYEKHTYLSTQIEMVHGVPKEVEVEVTTSLYVENAPAGVVGVSDLSTIFRNQFEQFVHTEMDGMVMESEGFAPIYSIATLGSIGTVSHKQKTSDLDLQVQYELEPFIIKPADATDEKLKEYANQLIKYFSNKYRVLKKFSNENLKSAKNREFLIKVGHKNFKNRYPLLYDVILQGKQTAKKAALSSAESRLKLADELTSMVKLYSKVFNTRKNAEREQLLKLKIQRIQAYVQKKYPKAEVYLFAYSNDDYRAGKHGTTLESKEASGSAYQLILNYEVLMPGIQMTPMIPVHFLMPLEVNADSVQYEKLINYIRFQFDRQYGKHRKFLVDLGATPPLTKEYMTAHSGAVYWESFKASSGNLPKATLNLLRFEMLFDKRFNTSIIELIKNPQKLDEFSGVQMSVVEAVEESLEEEEFVVELDEFYDDYGLTTVPEEEKVEEEEEVVLGEEDSPSGMPVEQILIMEKKYPSLLQDPWWLRYKALKIGFGDENTEVTDKDERDLISRIIDLGFGLHMKISDVFVNLRENKKAKTYRERVLIDFLQKAFPPSKRKVLEHIGNGEVSAVIQFEKDLKFVFEQSMKRVQKYVDESGGRDLSNQEEYKIWYYYYKRNFNPPKNVIRRDILTDLKVPRGRLQIGIDSKRKWFFRSIQKSTLAESQYNTFGQLDHLPDEVDLYTHSSFLHGIAHCIQNGYYGVLNKGTLRESRTHLEYSVGHTEIGKASADKWAYIRPDIVDRLVDNIDRAFPPQDYDFRDIIYKEKEIVNVFICLNLLEYGRVSFMYRDNLKTWYVDEIDHPTVERRAQELYQDSEALFGTKELLQTIKVFFDKNRITDLEKVGVSAWVNPNSVHTHHPADRYAQKEKELSRDFRQIVTRLVD